MTSSLVLPEVGQGEFQEWELGLRMAQRGLVSQAAGGGGGGGSALFLGSPRLAALFLQLPTCIVAFLQKQVEIKLGRWLPIAHGVNLNEVKMCFC